MSLGRNDLRLLAARLLKQAPRQFRALGSAEFLRADRGLPHITLDIPDVPRQIRIDVFMHRIERHESPRDPRGRAGSNELASVHVGVT